MVFKLILAAFLASSVSSEVILPLVVSLWDYEEATQVAWEDVKYHNGTAVTAVVLGCEYCELDRMCTDVGLGSTADDTGRSYLAATVFDGSSLRVGAVGFLSNIPQAIRLAYFVMMHSSHSVMVGDGAVDFARAMGLQLDPGITLRTIENFLEWRSNRCQENWWRNVVPDPTTSCGPYMRPGDPWDLAPLRPPPNPFVFSPSSASVTPAQIYEFDPNGGGPDTISIICIDGSGNIAAGVSSAGLNHRIRGRMDETACPGSAAYASNDYGAAVTTGAGDRMVAFSPSSLAVTWLEIGKSPQEAADMVIGKLNKWYRNVEAGILVVGINGEIGAACSGQDKIKYRVASERICGGKSQLVEVKCYEY